MPNSFQFDPEDDEVEDRYPLIVFALGSSGIQNPGLIQYDKWIEVDPRIHLEEEEKKSTNPHDDPTKKPQIMS